MSASSWPSAPKNTASSAQPKALHALKCLTWYRLLRHLRKHHDKRSPAKIALVYDCRGQEASDRIRALLAQPGPCMVARFGNNELRTIENHLSIQAHGRLRERVSRYLSGASGPWWWDDRTAREMRMGAGFFPATPENLERYARLSIEDSRQIDVLGSWLPAERLLADHLKAVRVPLGDLEPYFHENPWSEQLRGKTVLVIHPFEKSIRNQYAKRKVLFKDPRVLPDFELRTFPSVQSIGGDCSRFADWFEALDWMEQQIAAIPFDVALIGAGAYGMPLAAFIKRDLGRKAVHLGGVSQLLFGIKGRRWDEQPAYTQRIYNDAWVRPLPEEAPGAASRVEGGCYW